MSTTEAQICEIFSSIQGEGLYLGERQIFIRFAGCNLNCSYCDSTQALTIPKEFKVEIAAGSGQLKKFNNPATAPQLIELVDSLNQPKAVHCSVSLTGGEPLLQVDFLKNFLPTLKKEVGLPVYLETNGTLPDHLNEIIDLVDIIAMDIKIPSATGLSSYYKEHKKFMETALLKELFVKIIFTKETKIKEIDEAISLIAEVEKGIPLVLQPVTAHGKPDTAHVFAFYNLAKRKLEKVRVIPQIHPMLKIA